MSELDDADLRSEIGTLRAQTKNQLEKIEDLSQEAHTLRNKLQVAERIQAEFQAEVEYYQQKYEESKASHTIEIQKLKEDQSRVVQDLENKIQDLEGEIQEMKKTCSIDKDELSRVRKDLETAQDSTLIASMKAELQEILEEQAASRLACAQHQDLNKILLIEKSCLSEELQNVKQQLEIAEEKLKNCKSDLTEKTEALEELRGSLAIAQTEISCLKAAPSEDVGRGNSLFAEVEDKRQAMVKTCSSLSQKYKDMKKDYGVKCAEISKLKRENLQLRRQWQDEAEERDQKDFWMKDNYEIRIKELVKTIEALKQEEKPKFVTGNSDILTYAEHFVSHSRKKMAELREEMERRSSERLNEAKALYLSRSEAQSLKSKVMSLQAEILVLRDKLQEANITDIPSPGKTLKRLREVLNSVDDCPLTFKMPSLLQSHELSDKSQNSSEFAEDSSATDSVKTEDKSASSSEKAPDVAFDSSDPPISSIFAKLQKSKRILDIEMKVKAGLLCTSISGTQEDDINSNMNNESCSSSAVEESAIDDTKCANQAQSFEENGDISQSADAKRQLDSNCSGDGSYVHLDSTTDKTQEIVEECQDECKSHEYSESISAGLIQPISDTTENQEDIHKEVEEIHSPKRELEAAVDEKGIENFSRIVIGKDSDAPKRSILSRAPRACLAPIDHNMIARKVRFVGDEALGELPSDPVPKDEEVNKAPFMKKRVPRPPSQPMKRRFIVSEETI